MAAPFYGSFQARDGSVLIFAGVLRGVLPCQLRQRAAVTMTLAGRPAPVRGSGVPVVLTGQLPEGGTDGTGTIVLTWRWANWCGSKQVRAQLVDPDRPGQQSLLTFFSPTPIHPPRCADRSKPSTFQVIHVDH